MNKAVLIISNALIWGAVLLACSFALRDTQAFRDIQLILGGGATISMLVAAISGKDAKKAFGKSESGN